MTAHLDGAPTVLDSARHHLVPGVAERHRIIGAGAVEATANGAEVLLSNGRKVLDFGSYAVPLFGHRPPTVVEAVHRALDEMPTSTRLLANPTPPDSRPGWYRPSRPTGSRGSGSV